MIAWLKRLIAWAVAGDELAELERWRVESRQVRRWMAEFPDVCTAIDHIEAFASGRHYCGLSEVREGMRNRAAWTGPLTLTLRHDLTPGDIDAFKHLWLGATSPCTASPAEVEVATDWDVAARS